MFSAVLKSQDVRDQNIYLELIHACCTDICALLEGVDLERDFREIESRVAHEGLSFLTKVLPSFYKHCLKAVEAGSFTPVPGFKVRRQGPLPLFLGGLVGLLFDNDGSLRIDRNPAALGFIGQLCMFLYKCEYPYSLEQQTERLNKFLEVEQSMPEEMRGLDESAQHILYLAGELARKIHSGFSLEKAMPRHGPGAVAGKERGQEKYDFNFVDRLDALFPWEDWFATHHAITDDEMAASFLNKILEVPEILAARGLFVNKDSRGPRYISAEPKELMWIQQAVGRALQKLYARHPLTRFHINFADQSVNAEAALRASTSRFRATLDMEDASDRVSLALVRGIFPSHVCRLLEACRSEYAILPNVAGHPAGGKWIALKKFAPMGSAVCFPVESFVFWALAVATIQHRTGWSQMHASRHVFVYGDDIIVTTEFAKDLQAQFPKFYLVFSKGKCFVNGPFRESCGIDAIDGVLVNTVKVRRPPPRDISDVSSIVSWTDMSNQLFYAGLWRASAYVAKLVGTFGVKQYVPYGSGCLGLTGFCSGYSIPRLKKVSKWYYVDPKSKKIFNGSARYRRTWNSAYQGLKVPVKRIVERGLVNWSGPKGLDALPTSSTLATLCRGDDPLPVLMERVSGRHHTFKSTSDLTVVRSYAHLD